MEESGAFLVLRVLDLEQNARYEYEICPILYNYMTDLTGNN